jgi:hypothetical protein
MPVDSSKRLAGVVVRVRTLIALAIADILRFVVAAIANEPNNQLGSRPAAQKPCGLFS